MKDLEFIRSVVKEWPEGETLVRLDYDGEVCFLGGDVADFFPEDIEAAKAAFIPEGGIYTATGRHYTREQWAGESL